MYFLTYLFNEEEKIGILSKNKIIPLDTIYNKLNLNPPTDMLSFIKMSNDSLVEKINNTADSMVNNSIELDQVKILAPIPYPKNDVICLGKNYIEHAKEVMGLTSDNLDIPTQPIYFSKRANPAIGNNDIIMKHSSITDSVDYEVELAIIIGKDGINIKKEEAQDYIFGYTIANDISARNLQKKHIQWFKGKSLNTFCPMGPYIVHKSLIPFPVHLDIKCFINGELRQNSNTKNLIFDIPYIISDLSKGMKLNAGDIIMTGTPSGVGLGFKPFKFLKSGDKIECFIEGIGTLTNYIE
ncbi:fumarylacetoacetate hydrolase family protein [Abyssisolibacter fermentans]|uniref:fumarylacetoacetate hydrolase family protein n=1 Tax=Abyssisolibacter fermentans TaxID=1766203 RepID=UPI00082D4DEF|nr:fumarylacetoacetate hydrolase family protein [Abyssisolibacter fermentans]